MIPSQEVKQHHLKEGYSQQLIYTEIEQAINALQEDNLLHSNQPKTECIPRVVMYHPTLPSLACKTRWQQITLQGRKCLREIFYPPSSSFLIP